MATALLALAILALCCGLGRWATTEGNVGAGQSGTRGVPGIVTVETCTYSQAGVQRRHWRCIGRFTSTDGGQTVPVVGFDSGEERRAGERIDADLDGDQLNVREQSGGGALLCALAALVVLVIIVLRIGVGMLAARRRPTS